MEIQGGNGYVDDFVTNRLLRDAQVLPIWEGTENILALDVLRALEREDAHEPFMEVMQARLDGIDHPALEEHAAIVESEYQQLTMALGELATADGDYAQLSAKRLSNYIFDVFTAALLLEEAQAELEDGNGRLALVAKRFVDRELADQDGRGITSGDRFPLEQFEAVVRFASVDPESLRQPAEADD
jgi:hypothetical protein